MYRKVVLFVASALLITQAAMAQLPHVPEDVSPLLVGEHFPAMAMKNAAGTEVDLKSLIAKKPSVIIFYRGGWCPYCNAHLSEIGEVEKDIQKAGYQVIAISPDAPKQLSATMQKDALKYTLLSDNGGTLAGAMGIAYDAPEPYKKTLLESSEGSNTGYLPVPSVFVVNTDGDIVFEYITPNFKQRIKGKLLVSALNGLK